MLEPGVGSGLDGPDLAHYIGSAMNRFILALLALFAGLAAQATPAMARMGSGGETEIGAVDSGRGGSRSAAQQSTSLEAPVVRQERRDREGGRVRPARPAVFIPSVLFGVDRAFE